MVHAWESNACSKYIARGVCFAGAARAPIRLYKCACGFVPKRQGAAAITPHVLTCSFTENIPFGVGRRTSNTCLQGAYACCEIESLPPRFEVFIIAAKAEISASSTVQAP